MNHKMKSDHRAGFPMFSMDLKPEETRIQKIGAWIGMNSIEIIMALLFVAMIYGVGIFLQTTATIADLTIEYIELQEEQMIDDYQTNQVIEALIAQRSEDHTHPVTGAEMPPYWTAPEETN